MTMSPGVTPPDQSGSAPTSPPDASSRIHVVPDSPQSPLGEGATKDGQTVQGPKYPGYEAEDIVQLRDTGQKFEIRGFTTDPKKGKMAQLRDVSDPTITLAKPLSELSDSPGNTAEVGGEIVPRWEVVSRREKSANPDSRRTKKPSASKGQASPERALLDQVVGAIQEGPAERDKPADALLKPLPESEPPPVEPAVTRFAPTSELFEVPSAPVSVEVKADSDPTPPEVSNISSSSDAQSESRVVDSRPGIDRVRPIGAPRDGHEYTVGEQVVYTERDGDQDMHTVVSTTSSDDNPGLVLLNNRTGTKFAISGNPTSSSGPVYGPPEPPATPASAGPIYGPPVPPTAPPIPPGPIYGPPAPPVPPSTPPPASSGPIYGPPEPGPVLGPPEPTPDVVLSAPESLIGDAEFIVIRDKLTGAIDRLARAKDRSDSLFSKLHRKVDGRRDSAELVAASDNLKDVFAEYVTAVGAKAHENTRVARAEQRRIDTEFAARIDPAVAATLATTYAEYQAAVAANDTSEAARLQTLYYNQLGASNPDLEALVRRRFEVHDQVQLAELNMMTMIVQEMASARYKVDQRQLEIKNSKFAGKFREWWTKHPLMRAGIGAGLAGVAIVAPPLALGAFALRRTMGAMGTYIGLEGAGRAFTDRKSRKEERKAVEHNLAGVAATPGRGPAYADSMRDHAEALASTRAEGGEAIEGREQIDINEFIQEHYQDLFLRTDSLQEFLHGAAADPARIVDTLLEDRMVRLRRDSNWTRRSKYVAAVGALVVGTGAIQKLTHLIGDKPPSPGVPTDQDLTRAYFQGIVDHHGPTAGQDWSQLQRLNVTNPSASQYLWESNPTYGQMKQALSGWKDIVRGLPADKQLGAAKMIGALQDEGTNLNPKTLAVIIKGLGGA